MPPEKRSKRLQKSDFFSLFIAPAQKERVFIFLRKFTFFYFFVFALQNPRKPLKKSTFSPTGPLVRAYRIRLSHVVASRLLYELENSHETLRLRRVMRLLCFVEQARGAKRNRRVARGTVFLSVLTFLPHILFLNFFEVIFFRSPFEEKEFEISYHCEDDGTQPPRMGADICFI